MARNKQGRPVLAKTPARQKHLSGLYALTPELNDDAALLSLVQALLTGGCRLFQYRDKCSTTAVRRQRAARLLSMCRAAGAKLLINDDLELALAVGADGLHLGADDGDLVAARAALGPNQILGASCYADWERAQRAVAAGVDYIAFGAVFPSLTKPLAVRASLDLVQRARQHWPVAICVIGGITLENAPPLLAAGADMLAVMNDLSQAPDPRQRAAEFCSLCVAPVSFQES